MPTSCHPHGYTELAELGRALPARMNHVPPAPGAGVLSLCKLLLARGPMPGSEGLGDTPQAMPPHPQSGQLGLCNPTKSFRMGHLERKPAAHRHSVPIWSRTKEMWPQPERRGDEKTLWTHQSSSWLAPWRHPCPLLCATTNAVSPRETSVPGGRLSPQPHWVPVPKSRSPGSLWLPVPLAVQAGSGWRHRSARGPPCPWCPFDSGDTEA